MQGYSGGRGGYKEISRMNGGYGNRPRVGASIDASISARFRRDVDILLRSWAPLLRRGFRDSGLSLVWRDAWDGASSLSWNDLSPHFIEICRRVRLTKGEIAIDCTYTTTSTRRCLPETKGGDVGDPWIPIKRSDGNALTIGSGGFRYSLISKVLFEGDFEPAAAQELTADDPQSLVIILSALARGQSKTEGLHERMLHLPAPIRRRLGDPDERGQLGRRSAESIKQAENMRKKVLFPALKKLGLGEKIVEDHFDDRVDEIFFEKLFQSIDETDDVARVNFARSISELARGELESAVARCSLPDARRYRLISEAEGLFNACLKKQFPDLFSERDVETQEKVT